MVLTSAQAASLSDRSRVWQVRRFCQVRLAHLLSRGSEQHASSTLVNGDAALSALLRCLLYELDADLAAISLLDERTQYFLSVVHKSAIHDPTVRRADWFGCDRIPVRGGICERTITQETTAEQYPVYEILDLAADDTTTSLPVVNGKFANFKSYAGVPLTTPDGLHIGALFIFKNLPQAHNLSYSRRRYLCETARHTMSQLIQTVGALENQRNLICNSMTASFVSNYAWNRRLDNVRHSKRTAPVDEHAPSERHIYETAMDVLASAFNLESVMIQKLSRSKVPKHIRICQEEVLLIQHSSESNQKSGPIEYSVAEKLLHAFPTGAILQLLSTGEGGSFLASTQGEPHSPKTIELNLCEQFPDAEQLLFMPLWDSFHDRISAFIIGWTSGSTRVYNGASDLPSLSAFGTAIMAQISQFEAQLLSRKKSDFLGSISHEMRSPLHGLLASVSHLRDTECSADQVDLLESAESCGLLLESNIDNLLLYSDIGSSTSKSSTNSRLSYLQHREKAASVTVSNSPSQGKPSMLTVIEDTIDRAVRQSKSISTSTELEDCSTKPRDAQLKEFLNVDTCRTMIIVDATPATNFPLACWSGVQIIISNLLGNCIKFTSPDACIRVSLKIDGDAVKLLFVDSGRGMSPDFVRNSLFTPFAQQNPLDSGTGLGLSLVESSVHALDGELWLNTDESVGTAITVLLPRDRLKPSVGEPDSLPADLYESQGDIQDFSAVTMRLFMPTRWQEVENSRHKRSRNAFTDSLAQILNTWLHTDLQSGPAGEDLPQIMFVLHTDLRPLKLVANDAYERLKKVIFCPHPQAEAEVKSSNPGAFATIVGAVTPSKICRAVSLCHRYQDDKIEDDAQGPVPFTTRFAEHIVRDKEPIGSDAPVLHTVPQKVEPKRTMRCQTSPRLATNLLGSMHRTLTVHTSDPRFLLVDDNAINLKILARFASKCSKQALVLAGGGREAITALETYPTCSAVNGSAPAFDILLLDLSMPEVSGFEVASAVREMERLQEGRPRTYIAALTALTSEKDRQAAFTAGVDEYVTKPATLDDLRRVVANWRTARAVP